MSQLPTIVTNGDAWPFGAHPPVMHRRRQVVEPAEDALATREVPSVLIATTLLPIIRLPQRWPRVQASCPQAVGDLDERPTVVLPVPSQQDREATALLPAPVSVLRSVTPTTRRPEPMRYCYQCGAVIPPWRERCFAHELSHGRGLPSPVRLEPILNDDITARSTLHLPAISGPAPSGSHLR
jgi:hypothetical protein